MDHWYKQSTCPEWRGAVKLWLHVGGGGGAREESDYALQPLLTQSNVWIAISCIV